ncbi:MAG: M23 family metallopeptidase, partial [Prevotellaceae bacterium]|nr:M23 family metallopeptidase [Prevotellaceae bacterium]
MRINYSAILLLALMLTLHSSAFADIVSQNTDILQENNLNIEDDESDGIADIDSSKLELLEPVEIIPAEHIYDCWNNHEVNPYKVRLTDTPDTFLIDMSGYCHPTHNVVTSNFGFRRWRYHYGIDLRVRIGDSIKCAFDGKVRIAKRGKAYGNYVVVRHYNGLETTYAHMSKLLVNVNDEIKAGELVGWGGNTGRSTGPHLHFEMRYLGIPVNPKDFVDFTTGLPVVDTLL